MPFASPKRGARGLSETAVQGHAEKGLESLNFRENRLRMRHFPRTPRIMRAHTHTYVTEPLVQNDKLPECETAALKACGVPPEPGQADHLFRETRTLDYGIDPEPS